MFPSIESGKAGTRDDQDDGYLPYHGTSSHFEPIMHDYGIEAMYDCGMIQVSFSRKEAWNQALAWAVGLRLARVTPGAVAVLYECGQPSETEQRRHGPNPDQNVVYLVNGEWTSE